MSLSAYPPLIADSCPSLEMTCSEQIVVPPQLPAILKAYTKEVIRYRYAARSQ